MLMESPLPFILYTKAWLLASSYHLTSSLPLSNSLEYSWWIWKWEAKKLSRFYLCLLFPVFTFQSASVYWKLFSCWENILFFFLSPCFLFILHLSVINPHPQHSSSKAAFSSTDLELCNCTEHQLTSSLSISILLAELLSSSYLLSISTFFTHPSALKNCRHIWRSYSTEQ